MSFAGLADRSQRVARSLIHLGVQPGDCVGIHQQQTIDTLIAVHGAALRKVRRDLRATLGTGLGQGDAVGLVAQAVAQLTTENVIYLKAVAAGAVFMGANTYIGNAPNFMVKSIAEESGVAMPSFFGYMLKWSVPILLPLFVLVTLVFF